MADYRLRLETLGVASIEQRTLKARRLEQIAAGGFQPAEHPGQELTSCLPSTTTIHTPQKVDQVDRGWDSVVVDVTVELAHTSLPLPSSTAAREEFA